MPSERQTDIAMSDGIAHVVLPSQSGPWMPNQPSTSLISPFSGCSRNRHTTATATIDVTTGM